MPLWTQTDNSNGVPLSVGSQFNVTPNQASSNNLYGNTTANAFVAGETIGVYSVSDTEKNAANASSEASKITHTGWVIRHAGQGGRAGRVFYETLVAGGPTTDGTADDAVFPNT
jgi:hypothetical protein